MSSQRYIRHCPAIRSGAQRKFSCSTLPGSDPPPVALQSARGRLPDAKIGADRTKLRDIGHRDVPSVSRAR